MKYLWLATILLLTIPLATSYPPGQLHRLARLVMPYAGRGEGRHSLTLTRSLYGSSPLTRRQGGGEGEPEVSDAGLTDFEDEDTETVSKRQFDDYGHMRFGRNSGGLHKKFDDYGHMRYGK
uniref:U21-Austrotoxin-Ht1a_1 n=1 Tax=Hickmania troglodytes TaxID=489260 RepID=A0A482ZAX7_9ARAC